MDWPVNAHTDVMIYKPYVTIAKQSLNNNDNVHAEL